MFETAKSNDTYGAIPTTTTTATTTTAKPSKSLQSTTDHATCNFRLTAVYADEVAAHTPDGLRDHLKQGIAAQTGYAEDRFTNFQIADGMKLNIAVDISCTKYLKDLLTFFRKQEYMYLHFYCNRLR